MAPSGWPIVRFLALGGLLVVATALAGCTGEADPDPDGAGTDATPLDALPPENRTALEGTVFDGSGQPLEGVLISVQGSDRKQTSGPDGAYLFEPIEANQQYVLTASKQGYQPASKQALVVENQVTRLDFALLRIPPQETFLDTQEWEGLISCHGMARIGGEEGGEEGVREEVACGDADPNQQRRREFALEPGAEGLLIELAWEERTSLAHNMILVVEGVGFGDSDPILGEAEGPSVIKIQVAQTTLEKFFSEGGRLSVEVGPSGSVADEETQVDAGFALLQEFSVRVTASFGGAIPPGFSAFEPAE